MIDIFGYCLSNVIIEVQSESQQSIFVNLFQNKMFQLIIADKETLINQASFVN